MIRLLILLVLFALVVGCEDTEAVAQEKRKVTSLECAIEANDWMETQVSGLESRLIDLEAACAIDKDACQKDLAMVKADVAVAKGEHFAKLTYCKTLRFEDRGVQGE